MKAFLLSLAVLLAIPAASHAQAPATAAAADPVVGVWTMPDKRMVKFREDKTATTWIGGTDYMAGKWESDPFAEVIRRYAVSWNSGHKWEVELAKDGSTIRVTTSKGDKVLAVPVESMTVCLISDDLGGLSVNGVRVVEVPGEGKGKLVPIGSGDILTVTLQRRAGDVRFGLEIFRGNQSIISAKDFVYSTAPDPDWEKTTGTSGFRPVDTVTLRGTALGNVTSPLAAKTKGSDEKFDRVYFKYVVP